jgi:hypothetical protein
MSTPRRQWTPETIRTELLPVAIELGRFPKRNELTERGIGGLWAAMGRNGGVDEWREVVAAQLSAAPAVVTIAEPVVPAADSPVAREHVEIAAFFLFQNGHPGGPDEHWREAERALAVG